VLKTCKSIVQDMKVAEKNWPQGLQVDVSDPRLHRKGPEDWGQVRRRRWRGKL